MNRLGFLKTLLGLVIGVPLAKCLGKKTPIKSAFWSFRFKDYVIPCSRVPDDFLAADLPGVEAYINARLPYMLGNDAATEWGILYGDKKTTTVADLIADRGKSAWTFLPYDWEKAKLIKG